MSDAVDHTMTEVAWDRLYVTPLTPFLLTDLLKLLSSTSAYPKKMQQWKKIYKKMINKNCK